MDKDAKEMVKYATAKTMLKYFEKWYMEGIETHDMLNRFRAITEGLKPEEKVKH